MGNALGASEQDGEVYIERTADDATAYNVVHMTDGTLRRLTAHKVAEKSKGTGFSYHFSKHVYSEPHTDLADEKHELGTASAEAEDLM
jgi:hypothetical protein